MFTELSTGDHFAIYTDFELLHYTPQTNIMLCQLYFNKKKLIKKIKTVDKCQQES